MTVDYRRATREDSAFIQGVARHLWVRQNNPDAKMFCRWLERYMAGDNCHHGVCHTHFLITREGVPVGHIAEYLYDRQVRWGADGWCKLCYLGFDVHPDYWGQGIMKSALRRYISDGFNEDRFKHLIAECLTTNARSKRLLEGLGFEPVQVGSFDQFRHMWKYKGLIPKARYCYSHERWSEQVMQKSND
nr:GNAT family N-acetyltransferase [Thioflavicoccus mobilis]